MRTRQRVACPRRPRRLSPSASRGRRHRAAPSLPSSIVRRPATVTVSDCSAWPASTGWIASERPIVGHSPRSVSGIGRLARRPASAVFALVPLVPQAEPGDAISAVDGDRLAEQSASAGRRRRWPSVPLRSCVIARTNSAERFGIELMLGDQHSLGKRSRRVAGQDRHLGLAEHLAGIELVGHEMDGAAADRLAGGERALVGVEALILGQQRGVDVDDPPAPARRRSRGDRMRM